MYIYKRDHVSHLPDKDNFFGLLAVYNQRVASLRKSRLKAKILQKFLQTFEKNIC